MNFGFSHKMMGSHAATNGTMPPQASTKHDNGISIELLEDELWQKFHFQVFSEDLRRFNTLSI